MGIKKIKVISVLFVLIFYIGKAQNNIYIAPMDAETPYSISCFNLFDAFQETIKKVELNNKQIKEVYLLTQSLIKIDNKIPYTNIRYKGEIFFKNKRFSFCGDQASICINGLHYETSKKFVEYIKNLRKNTNLLKQVEGVCLQCSNECMARIL